MPKRKILVVDDSATDRLILARPLRAAGYLVLTARDGVEAWRQLNSESPDLVLLDVLMPGQNGFQLCRQIRGDDRYGGLPVIFVTAKDQAADTFWGLKQGATAYLTKPVDHDTLLDTVRRYL